MLTAINMFLNPKVLHKFLTLIFSIYEDQNVYSFVEMLLKDVQLLNKWTFYISMKYCIKSEN